MKECTSLAEAGYDITLIAPNTQEKELNGVKLIGFKSDKSAKLNRMLFDTKTVFKLAKEVDADVYHFHDPELISCGVKLKKLGKKVIYDAHEDTPRQILSKAWIPKLIRKPFAKWYEKHEDNGARQFDYIVTATDTIRDRYLKMNSNVQTVCNYPILGQYDSIEWNKKDNAICYVGDITRIRGIAEVVQAINDIDVEFKLGGSFSQAGLREEVLRHKGWANVNELGYLDRKDVPTVYAQSKIGMVTLHPTINYVDALPVKMFEYMAAGIPVIASNFPILKEIVETSNCGICVDPLNPKEIAEAIVTLLADDRKSEEMGKNGREAVEKKYNWAVEKEALLKVYKNLEE